MYRWKTWVEKATRFLWSLRDLGVPNFPEPYIEEPEREDMRASPPLNVFQRYVESTKSQELADAR